MTPSSPSTALASLTVLDPTRARARPTGVHQFADWGANVIKIEMPEDEPLKSDAKPSWA